MTWLTSLEWRYVPFYVTMIACGAMVVFAFINAVNVTMAPGDQKCTRWQTVIIGKTIAQQCVEYKPRTP